MKVCFHGTNWSAAYAIVSSCQFRQGSWFARHMEDAVGYGGPVVFWVEFPNDVEEFDWQFYIAKPLSTERIKRITVVTGDADTLWKLLIENETMVKPEPTPTVTK